MVRLARRRHFRYSDHVRHSRRLLAWLAAEDSRLDASRTSVNVTVVTFPSDELLVMSHPYVDGDGPMRLSSTGSLPTGISADVDYWIGIVDSSSVTLHAGERAAVLKDTNNEPIHRVSFSDGGSGTISIAPATGTDAMLCKLKAGNKPATIAGASDYDNLI